MQFLALISALTCFVLPMPGLAKNLQADGPFPGIFVNTQSSLVSVEPTNYTETGGPELNISVLFVGSEVPWDVSNDTTHINDSMTPRLADTPSGNSDHEIQTSSTVYYFQVIIITVSSMAVIVIAVQLTRQLRKGGFKRRFRSSGRRGTIGKRYSDISLQLLSRESGILDLPNISEDRESQVVAGKAEVVSYFLKENESPPLTPTTENGSLKSADGVWL